MHPRLEGVPPYSKEHDQIRADQFNRVRLALLRLGSPIRFKLPGMRTLEMILDETAWICIDARLNEIPVFAWTGFKTEHRDALHTPIECQLYTYHVHASNIIPTVHELIQNELDQRLQEQRD